MLGDCHIHMVLDGVDYRRALGMHRSHVQDEWIRARLADYACAGVTFLRDGGDKLGVARASVSHILAGRNKPGFDFLQSLLKHYPSLSIEWLISDKGKMYQAAQGKQEPAQPQKKEAPELFSSISLPEESTEEQLNVIESIPSRLNEFSKAERKAQKGTRRVQNIIVLYDDGTFQYLL